MSPSGRWSFSVIVFCCSLAGLASGAALLALGAGPAWWLALGNLLALGAMFAVLWRRTQAARAFRGSERLHRTLVEEQDELVSQAAADGTLLFVNPAYGRYWDRHPADMIGTSLYDYIEPQDRDHVRQLVASVMATGQATPGENRMRLPSGESRWVAWTNRRQVGEDGANLLHSVGRDITERRQAEDALRASEASLQLQTTTLQAVVEAIPAMVAVVGNDERYRLVNHAFESWMRRPRDALIGHSGLEVLGPIEYARSKEWVDKVLGGEAVSYEKEYLDRNPSVHLAISYIPLRLHSGAIDGFVVVAQDVTEHRLEAVRLLKLAERDALTGLLNRAGFDAHVKRAVTAGDGASLALLYIDLDHFKAVNDRHGHPVGDQVLRQFAQRLRGLVRPTDAVARVGGDEFAIVLAGVRNAAHAEAVADTVLATTADPFAVGDLRVAIGASVGLALGVEAHEDMRDLVRRADAKLYEAKGAGRGRRA